ncbi:Uu.00g100640.m01.CDS01 [Anthostomella pinea]|uniref:Uu.00g100640.m01.CDS01 n=1 Tax=Anthostomella pinea TaxID=933095 RepID=A0AAI8VD22_9PEZI|nr:Uu.00g100640.m01.CDS01 [Anthostomella pinea]
MSRDSPHHEIHWVDQNSREFQARSERWLVRDTSSVGAHDTMPSEWQRHGIQLPERADGFHTTTSKRDTLTRRRRTQASTKEGESESHEVFKKAKDGVDFRNVSWPRTTTIFLKLIFATGVLSMPTAMYSLGAIPLSFRETSRQGIPNATLSPIWAGFFSIFIAVLIVVIAVTAVDRPAAARQQGGFELGYYVIAQPTFAERMTATATVFLSSAGTSAFLTVNSETGNPQDYRKALYLCMGLVLCMYLSFSLVVYRWTGQWVVKPSL